MGDEQQLAGGQAVPAGDGLVDPQAAKGAATQALQGTEHLAPRKPQTPHSGIGTKLGLATLNMFVPMLGTAVQSQIKQQKEAQVNEAMNDYASFDSALEMASTMANAELASGKITQQQLEKRTFELAQQQPGYKALFDPHNKAAQKRLKNLNKVFQVDWMNPEKGENTVHYQALQRYMKLKPASQMVKMMAQGLGQAKSGAGQSAQPQAGGQPQPQAAQPQGPQGFSDLGVQTTRTPPDMQGLERYGSYIKALTEHQNRFEFHMAEDGKYVAMDKRSGAAKDVKVDGQSITGLSRAKDGVANVDGKPVGMYRQGKLRVPGDPNWNGDDQRQFDAAMATWASAEANKDKRVKISAEARARSWSQSRAIAVFDPETNSMQMVTALNVADNPGKYAPPTQAVQIQNRTALFNEINYTSNQVRQSIDKLGDEPFDQTLRAQLVVMLRSEDPKSYWQDILKSNVADKLTDNQVEYITGLISLDESALSLRSLGGMGQGSDQLRSAIVRMLPGASTPSGAYAKRQMDLFEGEVRQLKSTMPGLGKGSNKAPKSFDDTIDELFPKKPQ